MQNINPLCDTVPTSLLPKTDSGVGTLKDITKQLFLSTVASSLFRQPIMMSVTMASMRPMPYLANITGGLRWLRISLGLSSLATLAKFSKHNKSLSLLQSLHQPPCSQKFIWTLCILPHQEDINISSKVAVHLLIMWPEWEKLRKETSTTLALFILHQIIY